MIRKTRLFTPGPTPLLPAAQFAMAAADIHHRTPEFRALFHKVLAQLKVFVGTKNDVLLLSSSAPAPWKPPFPTSPRPATASSSSPPANLASAGPASPKPSVAKSTSSPRPTARPSTSKPVKAALKPEHQAVYMQATETSTAVRHDVQAIAKLRQGARCRSWSSTASPASAPRISTSTAGASTSSSAARRKRS